MRQPRLRPRPRVVTLLPFDLEEADRLIRAGIMCRLCGECLRTDRCGGLCGR